MKYVNKLYIDLEEKFNKLEIPSDARPAFVSILVECWEDFQQIYYSKIPQLIKQDIKNPEKIRSILYSLQVNFEHLGWCIHDAKKSFRNFEKILDKKIDKIRKARPIITRKKVMKMIEKCLDKKISIEQLINWSFIHWDDRYEKVYYKPIFDVMSYLGGRKNDKSRNKSMSKYGIHFKKDNITSQNLKSMIKKLKS